MAIKMVFALPAGNAIQFSIAPPVGAAGYRILRRTVDTFSGPSDPAADVLVDNAFDLGYIDIHNLINGQVYYYRVYYRRQDGTWLEEFDRAEGTPRAYYAGDDLDPQTLVAERLKAGLAVEVQRNPKLANPETGKIQVVLAPFVLENQAKFPIVSVHLEHDAPAERGIGEVLYPDRHNIPGGWQEISGWLSRVTLSIVGVTQNPNQRVMLRRAIARIIKANFSVFYGRGLDQIDFTQRDADDFENNTPLHMTMGSFTCIAPSYVTDVVGEIEDVEVEAFPKDPHLHGSSQFEWE